MSWCVESLTYLLFVKTWVFEMGVSLQAGERVLEAAMHHPPNSAAEPQSNPWLLGWAVPKGQKH